MEEVNRSARPIGESDALRRKRLLFQSRHRGTKETDLLLGSFAEAHLATLSAEELDRYEALLEEHDSDLFNWITGRSPPPPEHDTMIMRLLQSYRHGA